MEHHMTHLEMWVVMDLHLIDNEAQYGKYGYHIYK